VDPFLDDLQIFAGLRPLRRETVDVREVLDEATEALSPAADVRIVRRYEGRILLSVDRWLLAHAIRNLVLNALDAVGQEGVVVMELKRDAPGIVLSVTDNGAGVPPDSLAQIFDPGFTTKAGGTGLGLTIVQRVAEAHGATLEVRNAHGGGASFSMRWPTETMDS
jgi:signal transduction histidine kinase